MSTKKTVKSANNLVENVNVPNMDREAKKYERKPILNLEVIRPDSVDLFDIINDEVELNAMHMPNGKNHVKLIGCYLVKKHVADAPDKEWLEMHLKNDDGIEEVVSLFPGNKYTDRIGVVHNAGHNWTAFAEEIRNQRNKAGIGMKPMKLGAILVSECTKGFDTWILNDGKYTNMYATEDKYQNALDKLVKDRKQGSPVKEKKENRDSKAPWEE